MDFLTAIPWNLIVIQTVNGIVTGMILALIASGKKSGAGIGQKAREALIASPC